METRKKVLRNFLSCETIREYQKILIKNEIRRRGWIIPLIFLLFYFIGIKKIAITIVAIAFLHIISWLCWFIAGIFTTSWLLLLFSIFLAVSYSYGYAGRFLLAVIVVCVYDFITLNIAANFKVYRINPVMDYIEHLKYIKSPRENLETAFSRTCAMMIHRTDAMIYLLQNRQKNDNLFPPQQNKKFEEYNKLFIQDLICLARREEVSYLGLIRMEGDDVVLEPCFENFEQSLIK